MKKILFFAFGLIINSMVYSQNGQNHRDLNWVHGFVGAETSWEDFDNYFSNIFDITTKRVDYSSKGGLDAAATESLPQLTTNGENPFVVAHSMGGLVTRNMYSLNPNAFTGYVTFGTPHNGARFANSYFNGDLQDYTTNFIDEVIIEPLAALGGIGSALLSLGWFEYFGSDNPAFLSGVIFSIVDMIMHGDTDAATIGDLQEGGAFINNLVHPAVPKVNFYGVEDSPVHWRFLSSFEFDSENTLPNAMAGIETLYEVGYYTSIAGAATCGVLSFFNPGCIPEAAYFGNLAYQLNDGINTLQQSEAGWLDLIGCVDFNGWDCETIENITYDYDRDGDADNRDLEIADSCYRAKLQWEKFDIGDTIKIVIDGIKCTEDKNNTTTTFVIDTSSNTREEKITLRMPGPCEPNEIISYEESCVPIYVEADVSDGFIRSGVTEEPDRLEWVELKHLNHQELKSHEDSKTHLKNLFKNEGMYSSPDPNFSKFGYFKLREK